jgi:hypothetical protein
LWPQKFRIITVEIGAQKVIFPFVRNQQQLHQL